MLDHKSKLAFFSWSKFEKCEIAAGRLFKFEERYFEIEERYFEIEEWLFEIDRGPSIKKIAFSVSMSL